MDPRKGWLAAVPPDLGKDRLAALLSRHWGLGGRLERLYAERDLNVRLTADDGSSYLLKVANQDAPAERLALQDRIHLHLEDRAPALPVPRLVPARDGRGRIPLRNVGTSACLLTWRPGQTLDLALASPAARRAVGAIAAQTGLALADCPADGTPERLPWDLQRLQTLAAWIDGLPDPALVRPVSEVLDLHRETLLPGLGALPRQLIHNDLNPDNVLLDPKDPGRVTGVIDFGDAVIAPVICDLAVAGAYLVEAAGDAPFAGVLEAASAFHRVRPLGAQEQALLPGLVASRLATTLLIQGARLAGADDGPDAERLRSLALTGRCLVRLLDTGMAVLAEQVAAVCSPADG